MSGSRPINLSPKAKQWETKWSEIYASRWLVRDDGRYFYRPVPPESAAQTEERRRDPFRVIRELEDQINRRPAAAPITAPPPLQRAVGQTPDKETP